MWLYLCVLGSNTTTQRSNERKEKKSSKIYTRTDFVEWVKRQDNPHKVFTRIETINYFRVERTSASAKARKRKKNKRWKCPWSQMLVNIHLIFRIVNDKRMHNIQCFCLHAMRILPSCVLFFVAFYLQRAPVYYFEIYGHLIWMFRLLHSLNKKTWNDQQTTLIKFRLAVYLVFYSYPVCVHSLVLSVAIVSELPLFRVNELLPSRKVHSTLGFNIERSSHEHYEYALVRSNKKGKKILKMKNFKSFTVLYNQRGHKFLLQTFSHQIPCHLFSSFFARDELKHYKKLWV